MKQPTEQTKPVSTTGTTSGILPEPVYIIPTRNRAERRRVVRQSRKGYGSHSQYYFKKK